VVEELRGRLFKGTSKILICQKCGQNLKKMGKEVPFFFQILMKFNLFAKEWK